MFQVVPVIDLRDGGVVHARRGDRGRYPPLRSPLCSGNDPVAVVGGLLGLHPFRVVYVADLDAIEGTGDNRSALARLRAAYPETGFWVDAGFRSADAVRGFVASGIGDAVIGSESLSGIEELERLRAEAAWARTVLSLDFRDRFVGPPELLDRTDLWPRRVIAMTLARVGSGEGPDWDRLADIARAKPQAAVFAAGGVRDGGDLMALAARGSAGALVATALHDGRIGRADLQAL
ncbi:HisA/HisF-related TIM barrel protein [Azospirillum rugosum]|uniref:Phosphoribosylformimino-5-aminoimidazole carboxamide ribotide isomerase n=1 Tax=Azospirillum rugosum TaxID=416170 RepID=A0ABS4SUN8_9PROT|nr:HisA/HisF-related TIM barrel protein [Azospirillum rugosum]MBP2296282.1 phosphoribosylformimino-5-aminoimidazole carboxamide ribotide isomerase [Azospirillum rugosum]MDQ0529803.1 phosphoribosylformimino-5-aminoimidazole carboxamide ribotide isomerase [Azospirillum rugosum]